MTFLLGRQAMFGHDPPIYFRSTTAVRLPSLAIVQAANLPAVPPPSTRVSKFSGAFIRFISFRGPLIISSEELLDEGCRPLHRRCRAAQYPDGTSAYAMPVRFPSAKATSSG